MKKTHLATIASLTLAALALLPRPSRAADFSDPKQTLLTLCDAFKSKDAKTIHEAFYIDKTHEQPAATYLSAIDASLHFQKSMETKFGHAGTDAVQGSQGPNAMLAQIAKSLDNATVTINNDTATLQLDDEIAAKSPSNGKVDFRKINDQWKVDAASMLRLDDPRVKSNLPLIQKIGDATELTAKEVDSEKLQTIQQAQQALVQRTIAIIKEARDAATQPAPATPPTK